MALGTVFSGNVKCDWCGKFMKNTDNGILNVAGFGLVSRIGNAAVKHYCSRACKEAAKEANQTSSDDGGKTGGGFFSQQNPTDAEVAAQTSKGEAEREELELVSSFSFGETPNEISNQLSDLFSRYGTHNKNFMAAMPHDGAMKNAIKEKIEYGLMRLKRIDPAGAEYFQKKFDDIQKGALGKLFGKK